MKIHSEEKIKRLKSLRKQGRSIQEIMQELSLPKTTVWHHIQGIILTNAQKNILRLNQGGSKIRKEKAIKEAENFSTKMLKGVYRESAIIIAMLYWGEGSKKDRCEFINSDGNMIRVYIKILRHVFKVTEDSIDITMRIFSGMNRKKCLDYWSKITQISKSNIRIRLNDGGTKCRTQYGMCRITIRKSHKLLKLVHSLIKLVTQDVLTKPS